MSNYIQVFTAVEKKADAERIAQVLVEKRLAGCVQIVGSIQSTYWWKDKIEISEEWLCLIKSMGDRYDELEKAIKELHPYECPEILAIPIVCGYKDYLNWLDEELTKWKGR